VAVIITFRGTLVLEGGVHIGSGGGNSDTDATIVRDSRGAPYIPGSSLRGSFRAAIERVGPYLLGLLTAREQKALDDDLKQLGIERLHTDADITALLIQELRTVERLFGSTHWASPLTIPDLPLITGDPAATDIRHGVGINRDTGAAEDQMKYDFEVLSRDHSFRFRMRCELEPDYAQDWQRLLAIGLRFLQQGELTLGGRAARGVGQVRLVGLEVYELNTSTRANLLAALLNNTPDGRDGQRIAGAEWPVTILQEVANAPADPQ